MRQRIQNRSERGVFDALARFSDARGVRGEFEDRKDERGNREPETYLSKSGVEGLGNVSLNLIPVQFV